MPSGLNRLSDNIRPSDLPIPNEAELIKKAQILFNAKEFRAAWN